MSITEASAGQIVVPGKDSPLRLKTAGIRNKIGDELVNRWPNLRPNTISAAGGALYIGGVTLVEHENRRARQLGVKRRKGAVAVGLSMEVAGVVFDVLDGLDASAHNRKHPGSVDTKSGRIVDAWWDRIEEVVAAAASAVTARQEGGALGVVGELASRGVEMTTTLPSIAKVDRERRGTATSEVGNNRLEQIGSRPGRVVLIAANGLFPKGRVLWNSLGFGANAYTTYRRITSTGTGEYPDELRPYSAKAEIALGGLGVAALVHAMDKPQEHSIGNKLFVAGSAAIPLTAALTTPEHMLTAQRLLPHEKWGSKQPAYRDAMRNLMAVVDGERVSELSKSVLEKYPSLENEGELIKEARENRIYEGKVAVVTGATGAIGEAMVKQLALLGADVVMCARSKEKAEAVKTRLIESYGIDESQLHIMQMDLSNQESVSSAVMELEDAFPDGIDMIVNNAGYTPAKYEEGGEAPDHITDVNYLGPTILTLGLLPHLREEGQVIDITSSSQNGHPEDFMWDQLPAPRPMMKKKDLKRIYYDLKLATEAMRNAIAVDMDDDERGIRFVSFHPGNVHKRLEGTSIKSRASRMNLLEPLLATADEAALGVVRVLLTTSGNHRYMYGQDVGFPEAAKDPSFQQKVIRATKNRLDNSARILVENRLQKMTSN